MIRAKQRPEPREQKRYESVVKYIEMKRIVVILLFFIFLVGCATPYKKIGFNGGFYEKQIEANIFKVYFYGNRYTKSIRVNDFAFLRAAQITLENGFKYFAIVDSANLVGSVEYNTPLTHYSKNTEDWEFMRVWGCDPGLTNVSLTYFYFKPKNIITIICFNNRIEVNDKFYDAETVFNFIKKKYKLKI